MSETSIREFRSPQDYPAARLLWEQAGPGIQLRRSDEPDEIGKKLQRDPDLFLVAELDGELVGTVIGGFDGRRGMVYHLAVAGSHRREGIADALMAELEKRLIAKGAIRAYLLVHQDNIEARTLYEKLNWDCLDFDVIYAKDIA